MKVQTLLEEANHYATIRFHLSPFVVDSETGELLPIKRWQKDGVDAFDVNSDTWKETLARVKGANVEGLKMFKMTAQSKNSNDIGYDFIFYVTQPINVDQALLELHSKITHYDSQSEPKKGSAMYVESIVFISPIPNELTFDEEKIRDLEEWNWDGVAVGGKSFQAAQNELSLENIKNIKCTYLFLFGTVVSNALGLLLIPGLREVYSASNFSSKNEVWNQWLSILRKHLEGDKDILECKADLIEAGYKELAKI
ncbi:MAG: hypothetical protein QXN55_01285 [Candidatus Nitrosotenuis sp.]